MKYELRYKLPTPDVQIQLIIAAKLILMTFFVMAV